MPALLPSQPLYRRALRLPGGPGASWQWPGVAGRVRQAYPSMCSPQACRRGHAHPSSSLTHHQAAQVASILNSTACLLRPLHATKLPRPYSHSTSTALRPTPRETPTTDDSRRRSEASSAVHRRHIPASIDTQPIRTRRNTSSISHSHRARLPSCSEHRLPGLTMRPSVRLHSVARHRWPVVAV